MVETAFSSLIRLCKYKRVSRYFLYMTALGWFDDIIPSDDIVCVIEFSLFISDWCFFDNSCLLICFIDDVAPQSQNI